MSKGRILDVKAHLESAGLKITLPAGMNDLCEVQNEVIRWLVTDGCREAVAEIEFHLFDDLGRPTIKLVDILYVVTSDGKAKLYFEKRESAKWRDGLIDFVEAVKSSLTK